MVVGLTVVINFFEDFMANIKTIEKSNKIVNIPALKGGAFKTTLIAVARISHVFCDTLYIF